MQSKHPTVGDIGAGSSLGPYELLLPIAQGGMALVWAARQKSHKGFHKLVALKVMHAYLTRDPRFEQLFLAEAEFASRIDHPYVCSIRDLGEEDGLLYLAMEWVDGDTLASFEAEHPAGLPIVLAARIAADVATGLHAAHELRNAQGELLGLVHCDVSPQNILITLEGVVKIVDFGLARATAAARHEYQCEGFAGGKLSFMAPEQAQGDPIDRRTDVFALGIVLYRLLTGKHPFEGETSRDRLQRMLDPAELVPAPSSLRLDCPAALSELVMRALDKDPSRRFPTMGSFARALENAVPEIAAPACRDDLAELARHTVGATARKRRDAIARAIQIADARAATPSGPLLPPPGAEDLPSLPSSLLMELDPAADEISLPSSVLVEEPEALPSALQTSRPVAYTLPAPPLSRVYVSAALVALGMSAAVAAFVIMPRIGGAPALSARSPAAAQPVVRRAVLPEKLALSSASPTLPKRKLRPRFAAPSAPSAAPSAEPPQSIAAEPEPTQPAAKAPWQLEPGF